MRIERHRIGLADRSEKGACGRRQRGESAVGAIHVQPEIMGVRQIGDRRDRVEGARPGRAGAGHDAEGEVALLAILAHQAVEIRQVHAQVGAGLYGAQVGRADAQHGGSLVDA